MKQNPRPAEKKQSDRSLGTHYGLDFLFKTLSCTISSLYLVFQHQEYLKA